MRLPLPFKNECFEACYSHMLYCMALTTSEIINLNEEVHRILKPGGINIFTVRHTGDGDYKRGKHIGEDLYENDGIIVHFFDKEKINICVSNYKGPKKSIVFNSHIDTVRPISSEWKTNPFDLKVEKNYSYGSVSYTHLTLPTSDLV